MSDDDDATDKLYSTGRRLRYIRILFPSAWIGRRRAYVRETGSAQGTHAASTSTTRTVYRALLPAACSSG